jgi:hypothetical protein
LPDEENEFLVLDTTDLFVDSKALIKIRKITGMEIIQMSAHRGHIQLWFGRRLIPTKKHC